MGPGSHRRAAWATGLSLVLHVLALSSMVFGLKVLKPPPEDHAMELSLVPAFEPRPPPEPVRRPPARSSAAPSPQPRLAPQPSPEAPIAAAPETSTPAPDAGPGLEPKGLLPSFSGRLGCDAPRPLHLAEEQRQACANAMARLGRETRPLALNIPDQKKADFDRHVSCRQFFRNDPSAPPSQPMDPKIGKAPELGYAPDYNKCPMGDRLW